MIPTFRRGRLALLVVMAAGSFMAGVSAQRSGGAAPAGQTTPTTAAESTGAISGVVIDGATERPLAGASVSLSSGRPPRGATTTAVTLRVLTDDKGRFIFTRLPSLETYALGVTRVGYGDARQTRRLSLADGQWISDVKVALWRFGAISGVVTDESGDPAVGVYVRALAQVLVSGLPQLAASAVVRTDDRGVYRLPGLAAGKYYISVPSVQASLPADTADMTVNNQSQEAVASAEAAGRTLAQRNERLLNVDGQNLLVVGNYLTPPVTGGRAMSYPVTFYPSARSVREAAVLDLKRGEERTGIDLQIRPVPVVRVSGVLEGPPEAEAAGMMLRLMPGGTESLGNGSEAATALVDGSGRFTFLNVPAGDYTLLANRSQMEYALSRLNSTVRTESLPTLPGVPGAGSGSGVVQAGSAGTEYSYRTSRGAQTHSGRITLTVGSRDLTDVVVPLKRSVSVSGRLVFETEPSSTQRPPISIHAEPADGSAALGMATGQVTATGANITFSLHGLQPGQYALRFVGGGRIKSITIDGKDITNKPIDTTAGRDITDIVITFTDKSTRLTGYVRDAQNQVATSGNVILFPAEQDQWTGYGFTPRRFVSVPISSNGAYTTAVLPAGSYFAVAVDESLATAWTDPKFLAAAALLATKTTVDWGGTSTIDLVLRAIPRFNRVP